MALVIKDRVKVTSTTTGTGTYTLGSAVDGFQDFSAISAFAPWDVTAAVYSQNFSVAAQDTGPESLFFRPDGTKMYILGAAGLDVNEYDLSTAWDISTAVYLQNFSIVAQDTGPQGLFFKPDGTKMYISGTTGDAVYEYDLSTAWNISTSVYLQSLSVAVQETGPQGLFFKPDGAKMYIVGTSGDDVNEYDLSTAWDISTAVYLQNFSIAAQDTAPLDLFFKSDGTVMYILGNAGDYVNEYNLSTAWNISTSVYSQNFSVAAQETTPTGLFFKPDGLKMYISGSTGDDVNEYILAPLSQTYYSATNGTDWEIGIGTCQGGTTLARTTILESSNSNAAVNWGAGDKDIFVTLPVEATEGTVPTADNSSVGTDLTAWNNLKKYLDAGVVNGVPYANNGTNGIVSTFSLAYSAGSYVGGVLAPNGDIHFVPYSADRGQKVSSSGVVSTYSLVYTTGGAYGGGVLAPNGDIHFVPAGANRGQKISAAGVVSTYSLVYTANGAYFGGVIAPNGDIYFIPENANRGQKVSAAGVVSTYSLVRTESDAYNGGVLAPNGDIHFIPRSAAVGQKVSASGVVSTYSLVYTGTSVYSGGVLSPNGDIHFVPRAAAVGQKISSAGVVSTYSLVYTTSTAYLGGVLAPNGDIHFVPFTADRGQKVSAAGVVSTYSLVYTAPNKHRGGLLAPNGDIYFIPYSSGAVGQKIATGVPFNIGYALNPYFNKF